VVLFAVGGYFYYRLVCISGNAVERRIALTGVISCFIGGFPNAIDKLCWTFFNYDTVFNSTWMFFFIGIGYICLFISACQAKGGMFALAAVPTFHKPMKYIMMLAASVGMLGFYITMYKKTRRIIGARAFCYLITLALTVFVIVFSAVGKFSTPLPNIIAQTANSLGYVAFFCANVACIRKLRENSTENG